MNERFGRRWEDEERRYGEPEQRYFEPREARRESNYRDRDYRGREDWESRERGFLDRVADEVRSWFGDDDAEHRRREDMRRERTQGRPTSRRVGREGRDWSDRESWSRRADDLDERTWARQWGYADDRDRSRAFGSRWSEDPWSERSREPWWGEASRGESYSRRDEWAMAGPHSGRGPKGYRRSDDRIREDLCDMLCEHGGIDARDVEVQSLNGEVTLLGFVRSRQEKRLAEDLADGVAGVREVHNQLRVQSPESGQPEVSRPQPGTTGTPPGPQDWRNRAA